MLLNEGNKSRTVAATNMNAESSRSHSVFCLKITQSLTDSATGVINLLDLLIFENVSYQTSQIKKMRGEKVSRLSLVDLAGSEKVAKTGVEGSRLKEGCNINKSLHTLGLVISTLAEDSAKNKKKHIPYRDSVLTWLLKDSIGGNSKTVMISTISPSVDNYEETLSTLRYADRANKIVNNAVVNEDPNAKIIRELREELETLKKELEIAKEKINADVLSDRLKESEKLYLEMSKPWNEKLAETEKVQQAWADTLQSMGISVQSSGIKVEKEKFYLVNLNADPSLNELLVYYLKDLTLVGRADAKQKQDIQLMGPGISAEHCAFYMKNNHVCIAPIKDASTWVNGKNIHEETVLQHGDRIVLGVNHFFRLNCPTGSHLNENNKLKCSPSVTDFKRAQEEVLIHEKVNNRLVNKDGNDVPSIYDEDESKSMSPTMSNSNSIDENVSAFESAIHKMEQDFQSVRLNTMDTLSSSSTSSFNRLTNLGNQKINQVSSADFHFRIGLQKLKEKLLHAHAMAREANKICQDMSKYLRFCVTLQIPPYNLTSTRDKESLLCEPVIVCKYKMSSNEYDQTEHAAEIAKLLIYYNEFEYYIVQLREAFANRDLSVIDRLVSTLAVKESNYYNLIGVANLFVDLSLLQTLAAPFEYSLPIINQQGEKAGCLKIGLTLLTNRCDQSNDDSDRSSKLFEEKPCDLLRVRFRIIEAYDLPANSLVYCKYCFHNHFDAIIVKSKSDHTAVIKFNHEKEFTIDMSEEVELRSQFTMPIEVLAHKDHLKLNAQSKMTEKCAKNKLNTKKEREIDEKMNKFNQYLVESWNEVSKAYELNVKILELDTDGNWSPVEVKQENAIETGGVYQLKQGQSRQIYVTLNQTNPDNVIWYNGAQFRYEPYKIDKISVGCVVGRDVNLLPLDSYHEADLNRLRKECKQVLETRKQYLYSQLQAENQTKESNDEEKERYESLCKQLVDIGEEQAAIDAPADNSGLPGSTMNWHPSINTEKHVPILFLDLNNSDFIINYGEGCLLKLEQNDSRFIEQKLIKWNDSSRTEIVDDAEIETDSYDHLNKYDEENCLKAVARWDSTAHQSHYLNQVTPLDKRIYLTIKVNLKLKKTQAHAISNEKSFVNVILRKRICITVYLPNSKLINLNRFKNLLNNSSLSRHSLLSKSKANVSTSITYRFISHIPRFLTEYENRESLASKAALSLNHHETTNTQSEDDSANAFHFEYYAKTIQAVDSILEQDRRQQITLMHTLCSQQNLSHNQREESFLINSRENTYGSLKSLNISTPTREPSEIFSKKNKHQESSLLLSEAKPSTLSSDSQKIFELCKLAECDADKKSKEEEEVLDSTVDDLILKDLEFKSQDENSKENVSNQENVKSDLVKNETKNKSENNLLLQVDSDLNRVNSNLSIASTLTNTSQMTTASQKEQAQIQLKQQMESLPDWVKENAHVIVSTNSVMNKPGYIRYIGPTNFAHGVWIGVELEQAYGKNDGSLKGVRYFTCPEDKGVFVRVDKLSLVVKKLLD